MMEWMRANGKRLLLETCVVVLLTVASAQVSLAAPADLAHQTDFMFKECLTLAFPGWPRSKRQSCLRQMRDRQYTHMYVYVANEHKGFPPVFDYYQNPPAFRSLLREIRQAGLLPVVWLNPDDSPINAGRSVEALKARLNKLVPVIDDLVSSYILGLEINEYLSFDETDRLGQHLQGLTTKKIAVHQTPGRWDYCRPGWCDYMLLQYGFGKSASFVADMTKRAIKALGKPVVAGEYNLSRTGEANARKLGDAAMQAGAVGFGNGGTPFGSPADDMMPPSTPVSLKLVN